MALSGSGRFVQPFFTDSHDCSPFRDKSKREKGELYYDMQRTGKAGIYGKR